MFGISLRNLCKVTQPLKSYVSRTESRVFCTLLRIQKNENAPALQQISNLGQCGPSQCTCQCREFHLSSVAPGIYHNLKKRRTKVKRKMETLRSRLERLDKEDRPTGCILCPMRGDIEIDYKNVRLLSQFVSPHTGRLYGKALTGLCTKKQREIRNAVFRAQSLGYMPLTMKYFEFHNDPSLF